MWIVNVIDSYDGLYVFEDEDRAREFAARFAEHEVVVTEEVVMNDSAARQFLIDEEASSHAWHARRAVRRTLVEHPSTALLCDECFQRRTGFEAECEVWDGAHARQPGRHADMGAALTSPASRNVGTAR